MIDRDDDDDDIVLTTGLLDDNGEEFDDLDLLTWPLVVLTDGVLVELLPPLIVKGLPAPFAGGREW